MPGAQNEDMLAQLAGFLVGNEGVRALYTPLTCIDLVYLVDRALLPSHSYEEGVRALIYSLEGYIQGPVVPSVPTKNLGPQL